jgi:hypothetical protein
MPSDPIESVPPQTKVGSSRPESSPLDFSELIRSGHLDAKIKPRELPAERASRLTIDEAKARHQLWKEKVVLVATLIGLGSISIVCFAIALRPEPSEDKKWAMAILGSIVAGGIGYLGGRASKPD